MFGVPASNITGNSRSVEFVSFCGGPTTQHCKFRLSTLTKPVLQPRISRPHGLVFSFYLRHENCSAAAQACVNRRDVMRYIMVSAASANNNGTKCGQTVVEGLGYPQHTIITPISITDHYLSTVAYLCCSGPKPKTNDWAPTLRTFLTHSTVVQ
jgi:hypothetical protein